MTLSPAPNYAPAPLHKDRFQNISGRQLHGLLKILLWLPTRKRPRWPKSVENPPAPKPLDRVTDYSIRATLIGHSTVLLQVAGLNILTDPVWSKCAGPTSRLGVKRVRAAAIPFNDLPKIDVVLLSHNHYDHLDRPTLAALTHRDNPLILTGLRNAKAIPSQNVVELDWWHSHPLSDTVRATYVPAEHFSARGPFDRNVSLWGGFVLETPAGTIYFAGDTGNGDHFHAIRQRFGPITFTLMPIGAYLPLWMMAPVHVSPDEAVAASMTLDSQLTLAIHHSTFPLADDAIEQPLQALAQAIAAAPKNARGINFRTPPFGHPVTLQPAALISADAS